ncbi:transposase [Psychrobacter pocilloporae]|uniref:transposase n=1 Tax=Psychrobacter pocilloporae TaxID=1775882 RepID=UPI003C2EE63C
MAIVTVDYDSEWLFIVGSVDKAYQHSTDAASCRDEAIGRQVHNSKVANILIKSTIKKQTQAVVVDRGYGSSDIRACVFKHCAESVIPVKSNFKSDNDTLD